MECIGRVAICWFLFRFFQHFQIVQDYPEVVTIVTNSGELEVAGSLVDYQVHPQIQVGDLEISENHWKLKNVRPETMTELPNTEYAISVLGPNLLSKLGDSEFQVLGRTLGGHAVVLINWEAYSREMLEQKESSGYEA